MICLISTSVLGKFYKLNQNYQNIQFSLKHLVCKCAKNLFKLGGKCLTELKQLNECLLIRKDFPSYLVFLNCKNIKTFQM